MKYERGNVEWIVSEIDKLVYKENVFDIAVAGEVIEHCAYPEEIVSNILKYVKPGGFLILTTPNGNYLNSHLPTFRQLSQKTLRKQFESIQFGPDGDNHLFLFKLDELNDIVPTNADIIEKGYVGGTVLINKYSRHLIKKLPIKVVEYLLRIVSRIPIINRTTCYNVYVILQKNIL